MTLTRTVSYSFLSQVVGPPFQSGGDCEGMKPNGLIRTINYEEYLHLTCVMD